MASIAVYFNVQSVWTTAEWVTLYYVCGLEKVYGTCTCMYYSTQSKVIAASVLTL